MFMHKVDFRDWEFEVDLKATQESYVMKSTGDADGCSCEYCKNYREQRELIFPEEIKALFNKLNIDLNKEQEISEYLELENGLHKYIGEFSFAGKILSGEKFEIENCTGINFKEVSENFSIAFREANNSWLTLMFETNIPWILKDAEDLLDLRAAQKEEADAPTISLSEMEKEFGLE